MTGVALSAKLGVSPQAVHNYESDRSKPSPQVVEKMSAVLGLPPHFFTQPERMPERGHVFYRSMSAATKSARTRAEHRRRWLEDITRHLTNFVELPPVNLPQFDLPVDPALIADDEIERAAEAARVYWRMTQGPIANMVALLENQGAVVARDEFGAVTLDGLSLYVERPYVMIGTDKGTAVRWRFDAAHELGHLVLHGKLDKATLTLQEAKLVENQAHRFASAFLLPMASFGEDFFSASLDALRSIKSKWKVSIGVMIKRARHCGLISEEVERRLWINYSRRGWRTHEPLDDVLEAERPRLLRSAVNLILEDGAQTREEFAESVALSAHDIESLCSLDPGALAVAQGPPVFLKQNPGEAKIYRFVR